MKRDLGADVSKDVSSLVTDRVGVRHNVPALLVKTNPARTRPTAVRGDEDQKRKTIRLASFFVSHTPQEEGQGRRHMLPPLSLPQPIQALQEQPVPARSTVGRVHSIIQKYAPKHQDAGALAEEIVHVSKEQGYDPLFVAAVIKAESTFNPKARSNKGAQGLMQIMPETGKWIAQKKDLPKGRLNDRKHNLRLGISYLKHLEYEYEGDKVFTLVAYNWGPGHVQSAAGGKRRIPRECMVYALKILNDYQRWKSGTI